MTGPRYAIYFAPHPEMPLWRAASAWLGRDAATGTESAHPSLPDFAMERIAAITAAPRLYGFHATLMPPFHLADGRTADDLICAVERLAAGRVAFVLPQMVVRTIDDFLVLAPATPCRSADLLAADCVRELDTFRAPSDAADIARRKGHRLTRRQAALLDRWGYPYVMEEFRFHMTLTGSLTEGDRGRLRPRLACHFAPFLAARLTVDAICLFEQPARDRPFCIAARTAFGS